MSVIRRVPVPANTTVQVIPPDGEDRVSTDDWVIRNPASGSAVVDLLDDPAKTSGQGWTVSPGDPSLRLVVGNDAVWAAAGGADAVLHVVGVAHQ